jgi:hypothetical protein
MPSGQTKQTKTVVLSGWTEWEDSGRTECDNSTNKWNKYNTKIVRIGRTEGEKNSFQNGWTERINNSIKWTNSAQNLECN